MSGQIVDLAVLRLAEKWERLWLEGIREAAAGNQDFRVLDFSSRKYFVKE